MNTALGRVHTCNFTRRAYRSRTVRVGLPVYTLRPLRRVRPVHSDHIGRCSQWTRTVRVGLALQCECSSGPLNSIIWKGCMPAATVLFGRHLSSLMVTHRCRRIHGTTFIIIIISVKACACIVCFILHNWTLKLFAIRIQKSTIKCIFGFSSPRKSRVRIPPATLRNLDMLV